MDVIGFANFAVLLFSVIALMVSLSLWRHAVMEWTKQRAFAIRADLFDAAAAASALNDPVYLETRLIINGLLRELHSVTAFQWAYFAFIRKLRGLDVLSDPSESAIEPAIREARRGVFYLLRRHLWISGIDGLLVMLVIHAFGGFSQLIDAVLAEAERVGRDDEYAREKMSRSAWSPQCA